MKESVNESVMEVFVEQPLASPRSVKNLRLVIPSAETVLMWGAQNYMQFFLQFFFIIFKYETVNLYFYSTTGPRGSGGQT